MRLTNAQKAQIRVAAQQLAFEKMYFDQSEEEAIRWFSAIEKAEGEILFNKTLGLEDDVLSFTSRNSGESRSVTKDGCSQVCPCRNGISYHRAAFEILAKAEIKSIEPTKPVTISNHTETNTIYIKRDLSGQVAEFCGGIRL